jgi:hypothetical protein
MQRTAFYLAIAVTLAMVAGADAQTVPPVVATSCHGTITSLELVEHASYDATFRNTGTIGVDDIHVAIPYGRTKIATFDVHDSFPPGADVMEHLHKNLSGGLFATSTNDNRCSVTYVHFVNGLSWGKPKP